MYYFVSCFDHLDTTFSCYTNILDCGLSSKTMPIERKCVCEFSELYVAIFYEVCSSNSCALN